MRDTKTSIHDFIATFFKSFSFYNGLTRLTARSVLRDLGREELDKSRGIRNEERRNDRMPSKKEEGHVKEKKKKNEEARRAGKL